MALNPSHGHRPGTERGLRIIIPARLRSERLPGKMLKKIGTKTLIEHVIDRVIAAAPDSSTVHVATDSQDIADVINVDCVLTSVDCRSGSDRCAEVADILHFGDDDIVVNVQGDMPFIDVEMLSGFFAAAKKGGRWDILTPLCEIPYVAIKAGKFVRLTAISHVGLYAFTRPALARFAGLPSTASEVMMRLEQARAVDYGFTFGFHEVRAMPLEINEEADLAAAIWIAKCLA